MNQYYEILGLEPGASKEQIKAAYRRLCQECHPDKLPPETPKKARHIVEEHFKQINEAYAYLMEHPSAYDSPRTASESPKDSAGAASCSIFDPARMEAVGRRLEMERQAIEQEYQQAIHTIDRQQQQKLAYYGLKSEDLGTVDPATKWGNVIQSSILLLLGLLVGSIGGLLGFLGYLWAFFCFWGTLGAMLTKAYKNSHSSQIQNYMSNKKGNRSCKGGCLPEKRTTATEAIYLYSLPHRLFQKSATGDAFRILCSTTQ